MATKPTANIIGALRLSDPPHIVAIQFSTLTPVGTPMSIVEMPKAEFATVPRPVVYMWWTQTPQLMKPIAIPEKTTNGYPNRGLRENVGSISETMPIAGRMRIYTYECTNN